MHFLENVAVEREAHHKEENGAKGALIREPKAQVEAASRTPRTGDRGATEPEAAEEVGLDPKSPIGRRVRKDSGLTGFGVFAGEGQRTRSFWTVAYSDGDTGEVNQAELEKALAEGGAA